MRRLWEYAKQSFGNEMMNEIMKDRQSHLSKSGHIVS
jgi:hypothetical protein